MSEKIQIEISEDEAIVLFDFFTRMEALNDIKIIEDKAEQLLIWNMIAILEKNLTAPLKPEYLEILKQARNNILGKKE